MSNDNPMNRRDVYATSSMFGAMLQNDSCNSGEYVLCEDVVARIEELLGSNCPEDVLEIIKKELS